MFFWGPTRFPTVGAQAEQVPKAGCNQRWRCFALAFFPGQRNTFTSKHFHIAVALEESMRSFILSVSADRWLTPLRNAVLAHAGYAVIPSLSTESALDVLQNRHVSAMVIGHSIPQHERQRLCSEGRRHGIPAVVLDRNVQASDMAREIHIDPSDGPEAFLKAIATVLAKMD
jgi:hypothetical protein